MFANHYKLLNLIAFIDNNRQQLDGYTKDVMDIGILPESSGPSGGFTQEIDGHNITKT